MTASASVLADMAAETEVYQISICGDCWVDYLFSHTPVDSDVVQFVLERAMNCPCNITDIEWYQDDIETYEALREERDDLPEDVSQWSGYSFRYEKGETENEKRVALALNKFVSLTQEEQEELIDAYKNSEKSLFDACFA